MARSQHKKKRSLQRSREPINHLIKRGKKAAMPHSIRSMLATLSEGVINNEQYLYEVKWDGYRITAYVQKTKVRLESWAD